AAWNRSYKTSTCSHAIRSGSAAFEGSAPRRADLMATSRRKEGSVDSFGAVLLRAGRADQMSNQGRLRVLRNLGIGFALPPDPLPFEPQAPHQHLSSQQHVAQQHVAQQHVAQWSDFATNAAGATLPTKGLLAITGS